MLRNIYSRWALTQLTIHFKNSECLGEVSRNDREATPSCNICRRRIDNFK